MEQQFSASFWELQDKGIEDWKWRECCVSMGQQLWREGEGSGLEAGEAPAGTTTAARD
jgi:hypothetical protein